MTFILKKFASIVSFFVKLNKSRFPIENITKYSSNNNIAEILHHMFCMDNLLFVLLIIQIFPIQQREV